MAKEGENSLINKFSEQVNIKCDFLNHENELMIESFTEELNKIREGAVING